MSQSQVGEFGPRRRSRHSFVSVTSSRKSIGGMADVSDDSENGLRMTEGRLDTVETEEMDDG